VPGVLKNAIDWTSRPWGYNSFNGKPAGLVGASISPIGTAVAQADLRHIMVYLNVKLLGQPELYVPRAHDAFDGSGVIVESSREALKNYMQTFATWVENEK
jgi:chromate reductase, NAD(P)H dehydrogenase (quinone)